MEQQPITNIKRYIIFFLCNIPGTIIELTLTWALSEFVFHRYFGMYVVTPVVSYEIAIIVDFILFFKFTWRDRMKGKSSNSFVKRLIAFNASTVSVYMLRLLMIQIMAVAFKFSPVLCNVISMIFSGLMNFIINEKIIFAENRKHKPMVQILMWLVKPFTRMKVYGKENIEQFNGKGVVYVCNHSFFFGQMAAIVNLPDNIRPLVDERILNKQQFYQNVSASFDRHLRHWRGKTRDKLVGKMSDAAIAILQDFKPIPVFKSTPRNVFETFQESAAALAEGTNLLIFPHHMRTNNRKINDLVHFDEFRTRTFNSGFAHIGKIYNDMTNLQLLFVPVYLDRKTKTMQIAAPIPYENTGNPRNDRITLSDKLYGAIMEMKESQ